MERPSRRRLDHESPYWVGPEAEYFITVCTVPRGTNQLCRADIGPGILESIAFRHKTRIWHCDLAVLMPDHVHLILGFPDVPDFGKIVRDWKHWVSRKHGIAWQADFFDHRIRHETDWSKGEYILQNPVRAGLVEKPKDWPWIWHPQSIGE